MYSNGSEMLGCPSFPVQWRWWRGLLPVSRHPCSHPSGTSSPWTKSHLTKKSKRTIVPVLNYRPAVLWIRITLMWIRMRIRIRLITLMRIPMRIRILIFISCGPGFLFDADEDRMRIQVTKMMRIQIRIHNTAVRYFKYRCLPMIFFLLEAELINAGPNRRISVCQDNGCDYPY